MPKDVKCKNCNNLNSNGWWCEMVHDSPDTEMLRDCRHFWQKTNGDKIRAMNNEELARFLTDVHLGEEPWDVAFLREICGKCPSEEVVIVGSGRTLNLHECDFEDGKCPHGKPIGWWLEQPVKEE